MSTTTDKSASSSGSLLGWLGRRGSASKDASSDSANGAAAAAAGGMDLGKETRRQLMESITEFLLDNGLEITPANLLAAHGAFSGTNPRLARQINRRFETGEGIDQPWLDEVNADAERNKDDSLERLISRFENNLEVFAKSTKAASTATQNYGVELEQHVAELDQISDTGVIISNLADMGFQG